MERVGKTTLAQLLYNDREVKDFDVVKMTKTLLESVNSKVVISNNLDALQVALQRSLYGRKFLFVLDDLLETYNDWNRLKAIVKCGDVGNFPVLERLYIDNCPNLKFLSISDDNSCQNQRRLKRKHKWESEEAVQLSGDLEMKGGSSKMLEKRVAGMEIGCSRGGPKQGKQHGRSLHARMEAGIAICGAGSRQFYCCNQL
ncbi:hypothetical protein VNO80_01741 [Phaseolus coccineus]|uniref:NB-ARC domain-containing protein n=1 Tax=Phaseolus coccineus TaxID=3886 RepID=A0AAN9WXC9_PHACN